MESILTSEEVASMLRIDHQSVIDLLEGGDLVGFKISNDWRVLGAELTRFLSDQMKKQQFESLIRRLSDPSEWAEELSKHPDFKKEIESENFQEGTFGAFLKNGLRQQEALDKAKSLLKSNPDRPKDCDNDN